MYKIVKTEECAFFGKPTYSVTFAGSEVKIDGVYRDISLDSMVKRMLKTPISDWRHSSSKPKDVEKVHAKAWSKQGLLDKVKDMFPEYAL